MNIVPVKAFSDNYIWIIEADGAAVCIDPGEAAPVLAFLEAGRLKLDQIWITHHHDDHTGGIAALKQAFPECRVYGNTDIAAADETVGEGSSVGFAGSTASVWHTPGHTGSHLSYLLQTPGGLHVFCGDTLFSGGCGRVFTGTAAQLYGSLTRFGGLPDGTLFYPAHEYTASNLRFAAFIEPDNADIQTALSRAADTPTLPVTLAHEKRINPFLRCGIPQVAARAAEYAGQDLAGGEAVFAALREWKNGF